MSKTVEFELSNGGIALIDEDDYKKVVAFGKWHQNDSGYAVKKTRVAGKNISLRMHVLINDTPKGLHTDHINGNRLDNRKSNLRTASAEMNSWNRHREKTHYVYPGLPKGISFDKSRDQYIATKTIRRRFNEMEQALSFKDSGVDEL